MVKDVFNYAHLILGCPAALQWGAAVRLGGSAETRRRDKRASIAGWM